MPKLKAFTLMELLIGMIIASIVISLGYSAYAIIYKQYLSYKSVKNTVLETIQLNTILNTDFITSEYVSYTDYQLKCITDNKILTYTFNDSLIIRTDNEIADTFKLACSAIQTKPIFNDAENTPKIINSLMFDVIVFDNKEHFTFTKNYSAQSLLDYEMQILQNK